MQGLRRFSYQVDVGLEAAQYNAAPLVGGGVLPQSGQDTTISSAALRAGYEIVPDYLGYIRVGGSQYDYWHASHNNSSTYSVNLGLQILLAPPIRRVRGVSMTIAVRPTTHRRGSRWKLTTSAAFGDLDCPVTELGKGPMQTPATCRASRGGPRDTTSRLNGVVGSRAQDAVLDDPTYLSKCERGASAARAQYTAHVVVTVGSSILRCGTGIERGLT